MTTTRHRSVALHGQSDIGMVREENQDSFAIRTPEEPARRAERGMLLVLADGMGGLAHGGKASHIAVETLVQRYFEIDGEPSAALLAASAEANRKIFEEAQKLPGGQPMGSTLTALVILDRDGSRRGLIAQVGDSRAYRISTDQGLVKLTRDHTLVQELADRGEIEPDSLHYLLNRNVLTRGLGLQDRVEVDLFDVADLQPGETFLLCSDGLYDVVADSEIESHALSFGDEIESLVQHLIDLARSRGAPDNVTICVARIDSAGQPRAAAALPAVPPREVPATLFRPISYFVVFALGAILTLLLESRSRDIEPLPPRDTTPPQAIEAILISPRGVNALRDYHAADPEPAERLRAELERFRLWLDERAALEER